jgi:hypothetical protein
MVLRDPWEGNPEGDSLLAFFDAIIWLSRGSGLFPVAYHRTRRLIES